MAKPGWKARRAAAGVPSWARASKGYVDRMEKRAGIKKLSSGGGPVKAHEFNVVHKPGLARGSIGGWHVWHQQGGGLHASGVSKQKALAITREHAHKLPPGDAKAGRVNKTGVAGRWITMNGHHVFIDKGEK